MNVQFVQMSSITTFKASHVFFFLFDNKSSETGSKVVLWL